MKEFPKRIMDLLRDLGMGDEPVKADADAAIAWVEARSEFTDSTHSDAADLIIRRARGRLMTNADGHELFCFYPANLKAAIADFFMREQIAQAKKSLSDDDQRDINIGRAINRCAMELPDGACITIEMELGEAAVFWSHADRKQQYLVESGEPFSTQIGIALDMTKQVRQ